MGRESDSESTDAIWLIQHDPEVSGQCRSSPKIFGNWLKELAVLNRRKRHSTHVAPQFRVIFFLWIIASKSLRDADDSILRPTAWLFLEQIEDLFSRMATESALCLPYIERNRYSKQIVVVVMNILNIFSPNSDFRRSWNHLARKKSLLVCLFLSCTWKMKT